MRLPGTKQRFFAVIGLAAMLGGVAGGLLGVCGPFTDVSDAGFCPFVLEIFTLGITTGTSPTTYDPSQSVTRLQMAAFLSRTVDGALKRGSRRAVLDQFWTPQNGTVLGLTTVADSPQWVASDEKDLWVACLSGQSIARVRASDGKLLETWTGAVATEQVVVAMGRVFSPAFFSPNGRLYMIDPSQPAGGVTTVASNLGDRSHGITFDGARIWTANYADGVSGGTVSIVTPGASIPWTATTVGTGFSGLYGAIFDGANVWVTDEGAGKLFKLDAAGAILLTVTVGSKPHAPVYDGANIWVPNGNSASVSVVRASNGVVLATLTGNGLGNVYGSAFDGQRVMVSSIFSESVSLWKAADLTPLGSFSTGTGTTPKGIASDGLNFWVVLNAPPRLARF